MASITYLQPVFPILLMALAFGIFRRRTRVVRAAAALLFLWSWEPSAALLAGSLEWWYPTRPFPAGDAEAIVVLSGGVLQHDATLAEDLPKNDTYVRVAYAGWLYRNWRPLPIVVSGGPTSGPVSVTIADVMKRQLQESGVPGAMIWSEARSKSTYQNAAYSAELLRERGIRRVALVTEAHHMLRAERAFRRQGLEVTPAPCAYRVIRFTGGFPQWLPSGQAIEFNEIAAHEWVGLLWYRLSGKA